MKRAAASRETVSLSAASAALSPPPSRGRGISQESSFGRVFRALLPDISPTTVTCFCACAVYFFASLATVFLNRMLVADLFPFPVTLSWFQQLIGVLLYMFLSAFGRATRAAALHEEEARNASCPSQLASPSLARQPSLFLRRTLTASLRSPAAASVATFFPPVSVTLRTLRRVLPLSLAFVGMIGFSNTCLKHVQLSTYQVARSLTLLFNMVLQRLLLGMHVSLGAVLSCGVVCLGFTIGSLDGSTLSLAGALTGATSSLFQAVYTVYIRKTLDSLGGAHAAVMLYNMLNAVSLFPPLIWFSGELRGLAEASFFAGDGAALAHGGAAAFWKCLWIFILATVSGVVALFLSMSSFWIVGLTSPLAFNVLGYVKACVQTCLGFVVFHEKITPEAVAGVALTLSGSREPLGLKPQPRTSAPWGVSAGNGRTRAPAELLGATGSESHGTSGAWWRTSATDRKGTNGKGGGAEAPAELQAALAAWRRP
ncbi:hypothetical protein BESB_029400 [Besnoitia besnoiti]|uniref:Sugar phosphate transporter domain-containing protein n=1 Tax=Besnoitia besnoiti TaxID=94643 RepID=A0A2A9M0L0_BESBE|nr:uncharacterized protein BESB_029400 [Besnoitia besnoiti]PFH31505.1 hypothetical protein BESB_029400 [Besnoitia besnoiti]